VKDKAVKGSGLFGVDFVYLFAYPHCKLICLVFVANTERFGEVGGKWFGSMGSICLLCLWLDYRIFAIVSRIFG
jgi:hypothetical protein